MRLRDRGRGEGERLVVVVVEQPRQAPPAEQALRRARRPCLLEIVVGQTW